MKLEEQLNQKLRARHEQNSLRSLVTSDQLIDFSSNDYLGLAQSEELYKLIKNKSDIIKKNGATGSRLLAGNYDYIEYVESRLSEIFQSEKSLIFNSGYNANLAVLSSIPQKGDTILYDEMSHACIKDGARLSLANRYSFKHNDLDDLRKKITKASGQIFIVVESIYSMDGDQCPLPELIEVAREYQAEIILDEAHSTGVMGPLGSGLSGSLQAQGNIFARIYTFGKGMGIHGAAVAGSATLIKYLINFARPFIYTTAPAPHQVASIAGAFEFLSNNIHLQTTLTANVQYFKKCIAQLNGKFSLTPSNHAVQGIIIPGNDTARQAAISLQNEGLDVRAILAPTVKKGTERLRVCLHSFNTHDEIYHLIDSLAAL
ncbi:aminotransferase class I/II-fold pyridoxal phosphate-dependent enzyme [Fulvivirga sediminis]|uniref:8-amino-7-oxononanoate synthase n=1 Tax=Fulvivirga sediminis TaxID=2803949 RepID=A0A937FAW5_9BACT|nr:8-amino-7-oxononanoate synthase [Fulvivirga sediminis]MBL3658561.1 8-amino-7-oxononanoate synthase [Fulvivirga sediminis]